MKVKSESEVAQSCLTLSDPMDCSLTGSSVHGIFQARVLEWGAIAFSAIGHTPIQNKKLKKKGLCPGQSHSEVLRVKAVTDEFGGGVGAAGKDTVDSSTHKSSSGGCMWKPIREVGEDVKRPKEPRAAW